jgi:O-antigen/teichoic acid export membrane protein
MSVVVPMVLPLIIVSQLGNEANAYFAMPWVICSALNMLTWNIAASFVMEASSDRSQTRALTRRSLRLGLLVAGAGAVTLLLGASLVLQVFGSAYAEQGAPLLRLMAIAQPATVVTTVFSGLLRIRRQVGWLVLVQGAIGVIVLSLTLFLLPSLGVTGVGVAYLSAEGLAGAVLVVPLLRSLRHGVSVDGEAGPPSTRPGIVNAR